jgi:hypothetical protein
MKLRFDFVFSGLQPTFIYSRRGSSALHLSPFGAAAKNRYETAVVIKTQPQHYGPKTPTSMEGKKRKGEARSIHVHLRVFNVYPSYQPAETRAERDVKAHHGRRNFNFIRFHVFKAAFGIRKQGADIVDDPNLQPASSGNWKKALEDPRN